MPSPNSQTLDFNSLVTTTVRNYVDTELNDNVFNQLPLFAYLNANDRKAYEDGGEYLVEPLLYGKNTTVQSFNGYDTLSVQPQEGITAATFNWKLLSGSLAFSEEERLKNNGKSKIIDLIEARVTQLQMSFKDELNRELFGDGTGNGGKDLTGLQAIITNTGILGGIDRATYTWWKAIVDATVTGRALTQWTTAYNTVGGNGATRVKLILATQSDYEWYEAQLQGKIAVNDPPKNPLGDLGFQTLQYKGATVIYDEMMPATSIANAFFICPDVMKLRVHRQAEMKMSDPQRPVNQWAWIKQILWMGNLTVGNCRRLGKVSNKS